MDNQIPNSFNELENALNTLKMDSSKNQPNPESIDTLKHSIDELLNMFKQANEELTLEQREEKLLKTQLEPIMKGIQDISEQNVTIANALVSVSDAVDSLNRTVNEMKTRLGAVELMSNMPGTYNQAKPSYQRFDFQKQQSNPPQITQQQFNAQQNNQAQLPPPPPPPPQAIPALQPNELGEKKGFY